MDKENETKNININLNNINLKTISSPKASSFSRPILTLQKSLEIAHKIYEMFAGNPFDEEMLAQKILKHKSANSGAYLRNKSSLSSFLLIEKNNDPKYKEYKFLQLTKAYIEYATELDAVLKYDALLQFFNGPTIYKTIKEWFPDMQKVNRDAIIMHVKRAKNATKESAEETADNFIESYEYVKSQVPQDSELSEDNNSYENITSEILDITPRYLPRTEQDEPVNKKEENHDFKWTLSTNETVVVKLPCEINSLEIDDLEDIVNFLNLVKSKLEREIKKTKGEPKEIE